MNDKVPWKIIDIYHDDPGSFPLEDFFPLSNADLIEEEAMPQGEPVQGVEHEEDKR